MDRNDSGRPWPAGIWWAALTVLPAVRAPGLREAAGLFYVPTSIQLVFRSMHALQAFLLRA